ncbi:MAG: tRNA (adenosine(37)-N6)-threonylcarbamoyltransferase complex transferase subunit TsaD [bacterium]|nr:tRNA (adenosine(37)-N6)-threonylcarbamoyltransferase complex transferase subunit TsaD [bacterium]
MIVLGIETSCDDTGSAVVDGSRLLSNVVSTQMVHRNFGGVVPELASRAHARLILPVIRQALAEAGIAKGSLDGIAATCGPGLAGSLLVGLSAAKAMALTLGLPFVGVNHLEGHLYANFLAHPGLEPPLVTLIVSGGHTQLVLVRPGFRYEVLGRTRDDAAGEAFDKVAKLLGLGFPGGPAIEAVAETGDPAAVRFPRAFLGGDSLDFSFSGVKTAVLNHVRTIGREETARTLPDIAAGFQRAVVDVLVQKTLSAAERAGVRSVCLAGGVALNRSLRQRLAERAEPLGLAVYSPPPRLCSDNAGMIAAAGHSRLSAGITSPLTLAPAPSLNF